MKRNLKLLLFSIVAATLTIWSCTKDSIVHETSNRTNITRYLLNHPDDFSSLSKVLELSETASFLDAYGSYTLFAPNNDAIKAYLQEKGKAKVEDVSATEWKSFVRLHLLEDSIPTSRFTDGKLFNLTMYGQYLTTSSENTNGITKIRINKQANVITSDISLGNGLIHSIDHALTPAALSLAQTLAANPDYSIFTQALKETGLFDKLNILPADNPDVKTKFLTVIPETDALLKSVGINNYQQLKDKYSNTGDPKLATDSLHLFLDYHMLYEAKYLADIISSPAQTTLAPLEVLTSKLNGQTILLNDDTFNGIYEPGFSLVREKSDITATNGVIHQPSAHFAIKLRSPYRVDFDVCTFPEMVKNTASYKKATYVFPNAEAAALSEIKFNGPISTLSYLFGSASTSNTSLNRDVLAVPLSVPGSTGTRAQWVEFRTPLIIKGRYKIWVGYYAQTQSSSPTEVQASIGIDGQPERFPLSNARTLAFGTRRPGLAADVEEAIGYKTYMASTSGPQVARMMGIVDITQTGRYWLRFTAVANNQNTNNFDVIQFIPINEDQQYYKYNPDGTKILRP